MPSDGQAGVRSIGKRLFRLGILLEFAAQIYADAPDQIAIMPKDELTKTIIQKFLESLTAVSGVAE